MGEISDAVRRCIEQDVFLQEALARGIVTYRDLARWLKDNRAVEGEVSSIAAAIKRHAPEEGSQAMADAWELLENSRVDQYSRLGAIVFSLTEESVQALRRLLGSIEPSRGESFRVLHDGGTMTVVLENETLEEAEQMIDGDLVEGTVPDLAEIRVVPPDGTSLEAGVTTLTVGCLVVNGLDVKFTQVGPSTHSIFVEAGDSQEAFDLLEKLTGA